MGNDIINAGPRIALNQKPLESASDTHDAGAIAPQAAPTTAAQVPVAGGGSVYSLSAHPRLDRGNASSMSSVARLLAVNADVSRIDPTEARLRQACYEAFMGVLFQRDDSGPQNSNQA